MSSSSSELLAPGDPFGHRHYLARRKVFSFLGQKFHIYDSVGNLQLFVQQKAFKLKEDIRVYRDESKTEELLTIKARTMMDFSAAYDVVDARSGEAVGALRRKGLKSMFRDEWTVLGPGDQELGVLTEDSMALAMFRRLLANLIPQNFDLLVDGERVADFRQAFNPFIFKMHVDFSMDERSVLDRRLGLAAVVLLLAIEGRQQ